jgi:hypothetical protein
MIRSKKKKYISEVCEKLFEVDDSEITACRKSWKDHEHKVKRDGRRKIRIIHLQERG